MTKFRDRYRIESARLRGWDYSSGAWYFLTVCTLGARPLLGSVEGPVVKLTAVGETAKRFWQDIPVHVPSARIDEFKIMPNHLHGIIEVGRATGGSHAPMGRRPSGERMADISPEKGSLSVAVRSFKSAVTRWCRGIGDDDFAWQSGFYEHIIRNDESLSEIRRYILENPLRWDLEKNDPENLYM